MSITIIYFVHGTTTDNKNEIATGWGQGELSELGIKQAKELGQKWIPASAGMPAAFDVIFCSDLKRAIDSARLSFGEKAGIIQDARLREINYGTLTGHPEAEAKANLKEYIDAPFPDGESFRDVQARMTDFLRFLKEKYDGKNVAIMAHQAPQLALDVLLKGKTWPQAIAEDWRKTKSWQPGWKYILD